MGQFMLQTVRCSAAENHPTFAICLLHFAFCLLHFAFLHFAFCLLHFSLCPLHFAFCLLHFAFCTFHFALCSLPFTFCNTFLIKTSVFGLPSFFRILCQTSPTASLSSLPTGSLQPLQNCLYMQ